MIDTVFRWAVARIWRRIIARHEASGEWTPECMTWKRENPERCMYCEYTRWANEERGMKMSLKTHPCVEGKIPPYPLPKARIL